MRNEGMTGTTGTKGMTGTTGRVGEWLLKEDGRVRMQWRPCVAVRQSFNKGRFETVKRRGIETGKQGSDETENLPVEGLNANQSIYSVCLLLPGNPLAVRVSGTKSEIIGAT